MRDTGENGTGRKYPQEVSDDIRDNDTEGIYIAVFLEEIVEILKVGKRLRYVEQRAILSDRGRVKVCKLARGE